MKMSRGGAAAPQAPSGYATASSVVGYQWTVASAGQ